MLRHFYDAKGKFNSSVVSDDRLHQKRQTNQAYLIQSWMLLQEPQQCHCTLPHNKQTNNCHASHFAQVHCRYLFNKFGNERKFGNRTLIL